MNKQERRYNIKEAIVFRKTKEDFGGLSNMAGGYALTVNGIGIRTSEALYQACRFPHIPEYQRMIIDQQSPMTAKMKVKHVLNHSRADWKKVRVSIMRWCLRVKLAQNFISFGDLLLSTGERPIVEFSRKDPFWGAIPCGDTLVGVNCLGRLLMELREDLVKKDKSQLLCVYPLEISNFFILNQDIVPVSNSQVLPETAVVQQNLFV